MFCTTHERELQRHREIVLQERKVEGREKNETYGRVSRKRRNDQLLMYITRKQISWWQWMPFTVLVATPPHPTPGFGDCGHRNQDPLC